MKNEIKRTNIINELKTLNLRGQSFIQIFYRNGKKHIVIFSVNYLPMATLWQTMYIFNQKLLKEKTITEKFS